jgi:hypothetical protein
MAQAIDDEVLCRDVMPAEIVLPDGELLRDVRVYVTSHRVLVFGITTGRMIDKVAELTLSEVGSVAADRSTLQGGGRLECRTPEGTAWVNRGRGCGCGSVLKTLPDIVPWTRRR